MEDIDTKALETAMVVVAEAGEDEQNSVFMRRSQCVDVVWDGGASHHSNIRSHMLIVITNFDIGLLGIGSTDFCE